MNIRLAGDYDKMSKIAADIIAKAVSENPSTVLGLSRGTSLVGVYHELTAMHRKEGLDFSKVRSVNIDEFYPISPENSQSYRYFMDKYLFERINIDKANILFPDGMTKDPEAFCKEYEKAIDALGEIDIMLLELGADGSIGFNKPTTDEPDPNVHIYEMSDKIQRVATQFFAPDEEKPSSAIVMGIGRILKAKHIIILATGGRRKNEVKSFLSGVVDTSCPATLLTSHSNLTFVCEEDIYPYS